ncbi:MAG: NAD(P)-dependent oxidoreductase [Firmicutes bacterium]|nr:NAD(P)-dependent oxidoreductase [Bacillota bacterium]
MEILVGYTGFVGQNLNAQHKFEVFNSANIEAAHGTKPSLCVYSGIYSEKFKADSFPEEDLFHIKAALANINLIKPQKLVLISTIDVVQSANGQAIYEDTPYSTANLTPYGRNRLFLEQEVRNLHKDALIMRLPGLFGRGIKKNFIFDLINYFPIMLRREKFAELCKNHPELSEYYHNDGEFYRITKFANLPQNRKKLRQIFEKLEFSALNFTDSRSKFAFYNLQNLWSDIQKLLSEQVKLAHISNEPVSASEIYKHVLGGEFRNELENTPFDYSFFRTRHAKLLGGEVDFICKKAKILAEIKQFIEEEMKNYEET